VKLLLANDVVIPDSKDKFGQTPLSWAARRGYSNVVKLITEKYDENSLAIRDEDVDIRTPPAADQDSHIYCHICVSWILNVSIHYHCGTCSQGGFDICQECIASGAFCLLDSHKLMKRMVEYGNFMEVRN